MMGQGSRGRHGRGVEERVDGTRTRTGVGGGGAGPGNGVDVGVGGVGMDIGARVGIVGTVGHGRRAGWWLWLLLWLCLR